MLLTHISVLMQSILRATVLLQIHTQLQVQEHDALVGLLPLALVPEGGREGGREGGVRRRMVGLEKEKTTRIRSVYSTSIACL